MEGVPLIDVSSEDDLLISSSSDVLSVLRVSVADNMPQRENSIETSEQILQAPELSASPKRKRMASNKYNLRKSLAWDNAFFTSEGVLNQEELAIVNSTFGKAEASTLPSILEDIRKSAESSTTLDSDGWELDNLEVDLFDNLRASIQKSVGKCDKVFSVVPCLKPAQIGDPDISRDCSSNKTDTSSHLKLRPPIASKRNAVTRQLAVNTSKPAVPPLQAAATGSRDPKPSMKPPRIASRATLVPTVPGTKAFASGSIQLKSDGNNTLPGNVLNRQRLVALKKIYGDSCSVSPKSMPSPSSSTSIPGNNMASVIPSSSDKSVSTSSCAIGRSPLKTMRKKGDTSDHSSGAMAKTPLRTPKSKIESRNTLKPPPANVKSRLRFSSVSPLSSVDSLVSDSSSSTSTVIKLSNSVGNPDAGSSSSSPSFRVSFNIDVTKSSGLPKPRIAKPVIEKGMSGTLPRSQHTPKVSSGNHASAESSAGDNAINCTTGNYKVKCVKPSGLRLPSPKIGYFDAEKTLVHKPNRYSLNGTGNTNGTNNGASKPKSGKPSSTRPVAENVTTTVGSPYARPARMSSIHGPKASLTAAALQLLKPDEPCLTQEMKEKHKKSSCEGDNNSSSTSTTKGSLSKISDAPLEVSTGAVCAPLPPDLIADKHALRIKPTPIAPIANYVKPTDLGEVNSDLMFEDKNPSHQMAEEEACGKFSNLIAESSMGNGSHSATRRIEKENFFPADQNYGTSTLSVELLEKKLYTLSVLDKKDLNMEIVSNSPSPK